MSKFNISSLAMAVISSCSSNIAFADQASVLPSISVNANTLSQDHDWRETLVAQRQVLVSKYSQANGVRQALYNPKLASRVEKEADFTHDDIAINQTFDGWDKANIRAKTADFQIKSVLQSYRIQWQSAAAETLKALEKYLSSRNDYSNEARAKNQSALAIERELKALLPTKKDQLKASVSTVREYKKRFESWQQLMADEQTSSDILIANLWRSGEINTNDYLMSIQQISAGKLAGIDRQEAYPMAHIDALAQSGQLIDFISPPAKNFRTQ